LARNQGKTSVAIGWRAERWVGTTMKKRTLIGCKHQGECYTAIGPWVNTCKRTSQRFARSKSPLHVPGNGVFSFGKTLRGSSIWSTYKKESWGNLGKKNPVKPRHVGWSKIVAGRGNRENGTPTFTTSSVMSWGRGDQRTRQCSLHNFRVGAKLCAVENERLVYWPRR